MHCVVCLLCKQIKQCWRHNCWQNCDNGFITELKTKQILTSTSSTYKIFFPVAFVSHFEVFHVRASNQSLEHNRIDQSVASFSICISLQLTDRFTVEMLRTALHSIESVKRLGNCLRLLNCNLNSGRNRICVSIEPFFVSSSSSLLYTVSHSNREKSNGTSFRCRDVLPFRSLPLYFLFKIKSNKLNGHIFRVALNDFQYISRWHIFFQNIQILILSDWIRRRALFTVFFFSFLWFAVCQLWIKRQLLRSNYFMSSAVCSTLKWQLEIKQSNINLNACCNKCV